MAIYEIGIMARATWNLHSLNNEGTVGNVTEPRTIVLADGSKTDGISGEMLKHIHSYALWEIEENKEQNFCEACRILKPYRANWEKVVIEGKGKGKKTEEDIIKVVKGALTKCELCDLHGFLVENPPTSRSSCIEFGWALGIPEIQDTPTIHRDIHLHTRVEPGLKAKQEGGQEEGEEAQRTAQTIFHRPTRSGVYAVISVFQVWRLGRNDVNCEYVDGIDRKHRYQLALKAYQTMFLRPEGAMTATRLPHTEDFNGVIVYSETNQPVPVISPLKDDYINELKQIQEKLGNGKIKLVEFNGLADFVEKLNELIEQEPYRIS